MIIPINEKYRINSDESQWILQKYKGIRKKTGEPIWESFKYFTSIENCVVELGRIMVRTSSADGLVEARAEVERLTGVLVSALEPHLEIRMK